MSDDKMPKLTIQEQKYVDYLIPKSKAAWEELAQFSKDPHTVKLKTIKKAISELRRKYIELDMKVPFNTKFYSLLDDVEQIDIDPNIALFPPPATEIKAQNLVRVTKVAARATAMAQPSTPMNTNSTPTHQAHIDFVLDKNTRQVRTKSGWHQLNEREWEFFKHIHANVGRVVPLTEFRDEVVYKNFGSKLPPRWFNSIMDTANTLRRQIPELKERLLTIPKPETSYLFR